MKHDRRTFLGTLAGLAGSAWAARHAPAHAARPAPEGALHIACNEYTWYTFYQRQGHDWHADLDASLAAFARSGIEGYEPAVDTPEALHRLAPLLEKHRLVMRSLYVNSTLHVPDEAEQQLAQVLAIAEAAKPLGVRIVVTNPSPIHWGGPENKDDAQLAVQAANLDRLGAALRERGLTLAYHNHDPELRQAAREFHHMMLATDPQHVSFCLDAHWVYRGAGDSQLALFDIVRLYGARISELHLRQSRGGVWTEAFGPGDIDYPKLAARLLDLGLRPHLVLEQAVEQGSPHTLDPVEAHRQSLAYARDVFAAFAS